MTSLVFFLTVMVVVVPGVVVAGRLESRLSKRQYYNDGISRFWELLEDKMGTGEEYHPYGLTADDFAAAFEYLIYHNIYHGDFEYAFMPGMPSLIHKKRDHHAPLAFRPVCGQTGGQVRTFPNVCALQDQATCSGKYVKLLHTGKCGIDSWHSTTTFLKALSDMMARPQEVKEEAQQEAEAEEALTMEAGGVADFLQDYLSPVCGSDRRTYSNVCHLYAARGCGQVDIQVLYAGECRGVTSPKTDPATSTTLPTTKLDTTTPACPHQRCPAPIKIFTYTLGQVCGTDGVTYSNRCQLTNARQCGRLDIQLDHTGRCRD